MRDVLIALAPAVIAGTILFGPRALLLVAVCVASSMVFEYAVRRLMKKENALFDLSAVVTGVLLALNLSSTTPIYMAVIGSFFAIVVVKQLFGGLGQNFANPALTARIMLLLSFTAEMTSFPAPFAWRGEVVDAVSVATPLDGGANPAMLWQLFLGERAGSIGETSAIALLLGCAYLMLRGVISWRIPVVFIGAEALLALIAGDDPLRQILSGGLLLGAIFMATDYTTSPATKQGQIVFAIGCALVTFMIRQFASLPEGVSYSILFMNILTPHIDRLTASRPFGAAKGRRSLS